jgi:hypothetical protein
MSSDAYDKILERIIETQFYALQAVQRRDGESLLKYKKEYDNLIAYVYKDINNIK